MPRGGEDRPVRMKSTLIRVEASAGGHRVRLFAENGEPDWLSQEVCEAELPALPDPARRVEIRQTLLTRNGASPEIAAIGRELHDLLLDNAVGAALAERLEDDEPT